MFRDDLIMNAQLLLADLEERRLKLATAESCTGGLIAGLLTEIPGSSAVVERGLSIRTAPSRTCSASPAI